MKRKFITSLILASIVGINITMAQLTDAGKFLAAGADDAEQLFEGYLGPYLNGFGASLTGGWYNTAKPHQLGGFDITATINTAKVPTVDQTFDVSKLTLNSLRVADGEDPISSTIAGPNSEGSQMVYNVEDPTGLIGEVDAFRMPKGTGFASVPTPMLQAGLGLIKDTEIKGRYMPTYTYRDSKVGMWGIGVVHGLKQYIPFIKRVPVLHMSLQYGYTQFNSEVGMSTTPGQIGATWSGTGAEPTWDNQKMTFLTHSHTGNLLISANLPVVCFYGGIGFASTKTNLQLLGDYPSIDPIATATAGEPIVNESSVLTNPFDVEVKNSDGNATKPRYNVGMRLKFAVVTLHFDYTYANYSMFTGGLGISFR